jgi:hypothetical protein
LHCSCESKKPAAKRQPLISQPLKGKKTPAKKQLKKLKSLQRRKLRLKARVKANKQNGSIYF